LGGDDDDFEDDSDGENVLSQKEKLESINIMKLKQSNMLMQ